MLVSFRRSSKTYTIAGAEHLTVFMRNQFWISPQIPTDKQKIGTSNRQAIIGRHYYTEEEKQAFREDADFHLAYRKELEAKMGKKFQAFLRGSEDNLTFKRFFREDMRRKLGPHREELADRITPEWSPGCRRMTVSAKSLAACVCTRINSLRSPEKDIWRLWHNLVSSNH